jgi:Uma2 family endonuclease
MSTARLSPDVDDSLAEALATPPEHRTFADVQAILGGVPLDRIMAWPAPGFASEHDRAQLALEGVDCDLRDGFLIARRALQGREREPHLLTLGDYQSRLFNLPPDRLYAYPAPGTAEVADCVDSKDTIGVICELFDGVLVGKPMGFYEACLAGVILQLLRNYLDEHPLGIAAGADGTICLPWKKVRAPDVCFVRFNRLPGGELTDESIPPVVPNFVVEVISKGNRPGEMKRKLNDYFKAGVQLAWFIYPKKKSAVAYRSPEKKQDVPAEGSLSGGTVLPGFKLKLADIFALAAGKKPQ